MTDLTNARRSGHFWFRMVGLLLTLALAWAAYALDRSMLWPLVGASAFALGILIGDDQ